MQNQESREEVILGVDTHLDVHVGVVIDTIGRVLGTLSVGAPMTRDKNNCSAGLRPLACYAALALKEQALTEQL